MTPLVLAISKRQSLELACSLVLCSPKVRTPTKLDRFENAYNNKKNKGFTITELIHNGTIGGGSFQNLKLRR